MQVRRFSAAAALALVLMTPVLVRAQHDHTGQPPERLGTVKFETTCQPSVAPDFDRAVALLHSFWFWAAVDGFTKVAAADPTCGIAYWGLALSHWGNPFAGFRPPQALAAGRAAVEKGRTVQGMSKREQAYLAAVAELYRDYETVDSRTRTLAYEKQMAALHEAYPKDTEATIYYALALSQNALPSDKTYRNQLAAGALLEPLFRSQPDHPGIAHYLIHVYDVPALAPKALKAATRYAKIAPSAPHALHMPSHTFTRVGHWQDSIDTNLASADAAHRDKSVAEELHALDYQVYAYLQTGQDEAARRVLDKLAPLGAQVMTAPVNAAPVPAGYFAVAAIPARYALERGAWSDAAQLTPVTTPFLYPDLSSHFARALGAARAGQPGPAKEDIAKLTALRDGLTAKKDNYWAEQAEIQRRVTEAWVAFAENRKDEAVAGMQAAADLEDTTEKSPVSPGPLMPARELLGDMLLALNRPAEALAAYEASMAREPNRFRGLDGGARAAAAAGKHDVAARYRKQLLEICQKADVPGRVALVEARNAKP